MYNRYHATHDPVNKTYCAGSYSTQHRTRQSTTLISAFSLQTSISFCDLRAQITNKHNMNGLTVIAFYCQPTTVWELEQEKRFQTTASWRMLIVQLVRCPAGLLKYYNSTHARIHAHTYDSEGFLVSFFRGINAECMQSWLAHWDNHSELHNVTRHGHLHHTVHLTIIERSLGPIDYIISRIDLYQASTLLEQSVRYDNQATLIRVYMCTTCTSYWLVSPFAGKGKRRTVLDRPKLTVADRETKSVDQTSTQ